jgi:hypothetical protein
VNRYNLGLILNPTGGYLLISLVLENYPINEISLFVRNPDLYRLTVLLKGFSTPLPNDTIVMAVLHLVDDGEAYKKKVASNIEKGVVPSLPFTSIYLYDAEPFHNMAPALFKVTTPSDLTSTPTWNETFQFNILKVNIFLLLMPNL